MPSEASAATQTWIGPQEKPTLILVDNQTPIQDDFFFFLLIYLWTI